jgi:hypothetical protein
MASLFADVPCLLPLLLLLCCRELYKLLYGQDSIYARTPTLSGACMSFQFDQAAG